MGPLLPISEVLIPLELSKGALGWDMLLTVSSKREMASRCRSQSLPMTSKATPMDNLGRLAFARGGQRGTSNALAPTQQLGAMIV